jgi:hypothetical protein
LAPTGISRRVQECIECLARKNYETALLNLFPAIDKTAKKRRLDAGVGSRMKSFLEEEEVLITAVATGNIFRGCKFAGMTFHDAIYKFGRTAIVHEGELDKRLTFNDVGMTIAHDRWNLPPGFIVGMSLAVVIAPENIGERTGDGLGITLFGKQFALNDIWGRPSQVHSYICEKFQDPGLFSAA